MTTKTKKRILFNLLNVVFLAVCLFSISYIYSIEKTIINVKNELELSIEKEWREQAKRTLKDLKNQFLLEVQINKMNPYDEYQVQQWALININGIRNGGLTSDAFMIRMPDEKFIWDGSPDCSKPEFLKNGRYMIDEPSMHQDPVLAQKILDEMRKIYSTVDGNYNYYWQFDDSQELLEWVIIPDDAFGFNYETYTKQGIKNNKYVSYILILGTQKDEIMSNFKHIFKHFDLIINMIRVTLIVFLLMTIVFLILLIKYLDMMYFYGGDK